MSMYTTEPLGKYHPSRVMSSMTSRLVIQPEGSNRRASWMTACQGKGRTHAQTVLVRIMLTVLFKSVLTLSECAVMTDGQLWLSKQSYQYQVTESVITARLMMYSSSCHVRPDICPRQRMLLPLFGSIQAHNHCLMSWQVDDTTWVLSLGFNITAAR